MLKEFKKFALQGNLIDIAIGLVMATAFGGITAAFVDGIVMPLVGQIFQMGDLAQAKWVLSPEVLGSDGKVATSESAILYGRMISSFINFIIIAFVMFLIIKFVNRIKFVEPVGIPKPTSEDLLTEIRDLLKK